MIVKENIEIGGRAFAKTYSNEGLYIKRDGVRYSEAIDPTDIPREYTETDEPIDSGEEPDQTKLKSDAFDYLTGRSTADE